MRLRDTWLEVDLDAIRHNAAAFCREMGVPVMAVVKANGYGHGAVETARAALKGGACCLAVATVEEGLELREAGLQVPVLVLGLSGEAAWGPAVRAGLTLAVADGSQSDSLRRISREAGREALVQLKLDTGMGRIGARSAEDAVRAYRELSTAGAVVSGAFTHFATADIEGEEALAYLHLQAERFSRMTEALRQAGFSGVLHASASAASILRSECRFDLVREGIALYGTDISGALGLREALCWKSRILFLKTIAPGETVSYGRRFTAQRPTMVATLPVGYADGYRRSLTGRAEALVRGRRVPVIGTVCMDQILLDVTDVEGVSLGDETVLLGRQGGQVITSEEMAGWAGTINYEIMTGISARVPRVYLP